MLCLLLIYYTGARCTWTRVQKRSRPRYGGPPGQRCEHSTVRPCRIDALTSNKRFCFTCRRSRKMDKSRRTGRPRHSETAANRTQRPKRRRLDRAKNKDTLSGSFARLTQLT